MSIYFAQQHESFTDKDKALLHKYAEGIDDFSKDERERLVILCGMAEDVAYRHLHSAFPVGAFRLESKDISLILDQWEDSAY